MPDRAARSAAPSPSDAGAAAGQGVVRTGDRELDRLAEAVHRQVLRREAAGRLTGHAGDEHLTQRPVDCLFATGQSPRLPDEVFARLRWGGQLVFLARDPQSVQSLAESFDGQRGFVLEQAPTYIWHAPLGLRLPPFASKGYYFIARKVDLLQPGEVSDRFTYNVDLVADASAPMGYVVRKRVPTAEHVFWRLQQKYPETDAEDLKSRAHKLVDHVFPTFLTREAAFLKLLQRDLPDEYRCRVPAAVEVQKDDRGFVRELHMNWLRNRAEPIDQIEFARQSADLLAALHEQARIMHLDLRLDNFVLTEDGVGFVDFGSAVRIGEQLERSNMLSTLFDEMMQTSQIQRMLGKMLEKGEVTSQVIRDVHGKVDKTVDAFYLAVQINHPHKHPELKHLVRCERDSQVARQIQRLTAAVLRPKNPDKAPYKTASDIRRGIARIERKLNETPSTQPTAPRKQTASAA